MDDFKHKEAIFVFGSNEAGIHGAGAAKAALNKGAKMGVGFGRQGQTFALPTKDWRINFMRKPVIEHYVARFIAFADVNLDLQFQVTCVGCGLGGWTHADIAPMFRDAPPNCFFDEAWKPYLGDSVKYWGTF